MRPPLLIPDRVPCLALNQPYAGLLFRDDDSGDPGPKNLETRTWEWPYAPGWLAVYATRNPDRAAIRRLSLVVEEHSSCGIDGALLGVVYIGGSRPMTASDAWAACYPYERAQLRYVWPILAAYRFREPNRTHLLRGPQKFVYLPGDMVAASLGDRASRVRAPMLPGVML